MPSTPAPQRARETAAAAQAGDVVVARAPGSVELLGEPCAATGGMLLTAALPADAAVAVAETDGGELVIRDGSDVHRVPMPDAPVDGLPPRAASVAAAVAALQQGAHLAPKPGGGLDVSVACDIPAGRGLGETAALQSALAIALNHLWGDRDDVPTRTRIAAALHAAACERAGVPLPPHPWTVALRATGDAVVVHNHVDGAVRQLPRPEHLALTLAWSPDVTAGSSATARPSFFADACQAFGVETLDRLPDADDRVLEWLNARLELDAENGDGTADIPTTGKAAGWLDDASGCSDRARAVTGHLRHGDVTAALNAVGLDVRLRETEPGEGAPLHAPARAAADAGAAVRCCQQPAAALVAWSRADDAADVAAALGSAGAGTLPLDGARQGGLVTGEE
ncbi:GHMP family kinase ATP-binding protein [Corynebacterium sp. 335C]